MNAEKLLSSMTNSITAVFALMGVAEEEIARATRRYPRRKEALNRACKVLLAPSQEMYEMDERVYRHHAAELLDRVGRSDVAGADAGTTAEVLITLHLGSLKAPFARDPQVLFERLFQEILPGSLADQDWSLKPSYPNADRECEAQLRRRLANPERKAFIKSTLAGGAQLLFEEAA